MKKSRVAVVVCVVRSATALLLVCAAMLCLMGCLGAPGESVDEVSIRHRNVIRSDMQQIQSDLDLYFMLDKPSKLTDKIVR